MIQHFKDIIKVKLFDSNAINVSELPSLCSPVIGEADQYLVEGNMLYVPSLRRFKVAFLGYSEAIKRDGLSIIPDCLEVARQLLFKKIMEIEL